jgi:23S rRNA (pseudouridine1915-N3)-methyltransferase
MKGLHFVWVGKLKAGFWRDAADHYSKRLERFHPLRETCLKDGPGKLPPEQRNEDEGRRILAALEPSAWVVCLDESGKQRTSRQTAALLRDLTEDANRAPTFVIGGAFGLADAVRSRADLLLGLSRMTLPHEMARVVLLEQLYRAASILRGLPYHHD